VRTAKHPVAVTCYIGPAQDLYHLSNVLTGFCELASEGRIELSLKPVLYDLRNPSEVAAMRAEALRDGSAIEVAFDVYDRSERFETDLLERCDIYFKRSYYRPDILRLTKNWQPKVVPFGFNYACRSATGEPRLRAAGLGRSDSLDRYLVPPFESFEQSPSVTASPSIVFQTRAWSPESTSDDAEEVNDSRVQIIRALRKAFPGRFDGGFTRTLFASQRYPDLVSEHPSEPEEYLRFLKGHLIGISTHGLHHSVPFKLPEYAAASIAIVSEPPQHGFPVPFIDGRNFLAFRGPEECIQQCDRILSDAHLARELREASWRYYHADIRPAQHVGNLLEQVLTTKLTRDQIEAVE
jgi:Glycosyl transferases group 1